MITKFRPRTAHTAPFNDLMSDLIGHDLGQVLGNDDLAVVRPKVNIVESPEKFTINILAPGFKKEELTISNENETLTVKGERSGTKLQETERFTRGLERASFTLPTTADIEPTWTVLSITIPRKEQAKPTVRKHRY
ncbi:MAG: Hsp20/alpha crystallin family protein [Flavobacteriales bacterium]